jgi:hypothetical protein
MNIIITAQVTYEIQDVQDFDEAVSVFQQCVIRGTRQMEGVQYVGTKELFGTEMTEEMTFMTHPQIWEKEEVE